MKYFISLFIIIFLLLSLSIPSLYAQRTVYKYPGNPVFEPGGKGEWDQEFWDAVIIHEDGLYKMWYTAWSKAVYGEIGLGYATSSDGIHWEKYHDNPLTIESRGPDRKEQFYTFDIIRNDTSYLLYYSSFQADQLNTYFGLAWSYDGISWIKYPEPVIEPGGEWWDEVGIGTPKVCYDGHKYHMWYGGIPKEMPKTVTIGYAYSYDGTRWTKYHDNPVFVKGEPGSFDDQWVAPTEVIWNGSGFEMYYFGWNYIQYEGGLATSKDGIHWTRSPDNPIIRTGELGSWDSNIAACFYVQSEGDDLRMWYSGANKINNAYGYATTSKSESSLWVHQDFKRSARQITVRLFNNDLVIKIDSLHQILENANGMQKIDALNQLAIGYALNNDQKSTEYALAALELSKKEHYPEGRALAYYGISIGQYIRDKYFEAMKNQLRALLLLDSLGMQREAADLRMQIAGIQSFTGSNELALSYLDRALDEYKSFKDTASILLVMEYIGNEYLVSGDTAAALSILYDKLFLSYNYKNIKEIANTYEALGVCYTCESLDSSLHYFSKARAIWDTTNQPQLGITYMNMAEAYANAGPSFYKDAEKYYMASYIELLGSFGASLNQLKLLSGMADYFLKASKLDEAAKYVHSALQMCQMFQEKHEHQLYPSLNNKIEHEVLFKIYMEKIYYLHYELDLKLGNKDAALGHFLLATDWKDSLDNDRGWKRAAMIQGNYEIESSLNKITILEKENEVQDLRIRNRELYLFALGGFLVIIALLALLYIRQNRIRSEHRSMALEQKLFRIQMNPHFIFNALSGIHNFIDRKELNKATEYLTSFSRLLRSTLKSTREDYIYLDEEITSLKHYLNLQSLRHADKFDFSIIIDDELNMDTTIIPPMLIQPFLENSIEHGIAHKEEKGNIELRLKLLNGIVTCEIEDDGVGREASKTFESQLLKAHQSMATDIIKDRIQVLNKGQKKKISLEIIDLKSEDGKAKGTLVRLELPYVSD